MHWVAGFSIFGEENENFLSYLNGGRNQRLELVFELREEEISDQVSEFNELAEHEVDLYRHLQNEFFGFSIDQV